MKTNKAILSFVMAIAILAVVGNAKLMAQNDCRQMFDKANEAYNNGEFQTAIDGYTDIENKGFESAALFFNKANAYYKMKDFPMSILYYEKALAIDPTNEDIKANLLIANMSKIDKIDPVPQSIIVQWWNAVKTSLTPNSWAWLSIILLAVALILLLIFLVAHNMTLRKTSFYMSMVLSVAFALTLVFAAQSRHDYLTHDDAIITTASVNMMSAPTRSGQELLVLHEGTKVKVVEKIDEWNKVRLPDGNIGWIKSEYMTEF